MQEDISLEALATDFEQEWQTVQTLEKEIDAFLKDYFKRVGASFKLLHAIQPATSDPQTVHKPARPTASDKQELQTLYRALVKELHPDRPANDDSRETRQLFTEVTQAYKQGSLPRLQQLYYRSMARHIKSQKIRDAMTQGYREEMQTALAQIKEYRIYLENSSEYRLMQKDFRARLKGIDLVEQVLEQVQARIAGAALPRLTTAAS